MSQKPRPRPYVNTLLRLDEEARSMLDEYRAANPGSTLHDAAASMISTAYALWIQDRAARGDAA